MLQILFDGTVSLDGQPRLPVTSYMYIDWFCCYRSLASLVDIIRLCKIYRYEFGENSDLIDALSNRISEMNSHSLENLVITGNSDRGGSSSASARWSNVLKKMKGKFSQ